MAERSARPSTDQETAPLLRDPDAEEDRAEPEEATMMDRINSVAQEPLTPLSKVLLVVALVLLLLSSAFIGLFAGVRHKLALERGNHGDNPSSTVTLTATSTSITTSTASPPSPTKVPTPEEPVCLSPECIMLSSSILSSLDTKNYDPCENFYGFANGGWLRAHPLPADKGSFGNFEALAQDNEHVIQRILEDKSSTASFTTSYDEQLLAKLRGFYTSCLDESTLDERGQEPLMDVIHNIRQMFRGKQTVIQDVKDEDKFKGLTATLAYMHSRGLGALFSFEIEGDVGVDPNHMALWFSQPSLGLPSKEYYQEKDIRKIYQSVIARLVLAVSEEEDEKDLRQWSNTSPPPAFSEQNDNVWPPWPWPPWGGDGDDDDGNDGHKKPINKTKRAHKLAKKVLDFESEIAEASLDLDILYQDPVATYNSEPISNLTVTLPQIHFNEYFSTFAPRAFPDRVIITYPPYARSLSEILNNTTGDVIETYLVVRAALSLSPYLGLSTAAWQAQRTLVEALTGVKKGAVGDRAEYCVGQVEENLGFAAGRYFVNETFGGESKEKGTKVITDIVKSFQESLREIDWMDKKSAKAASDKAEAIRVKVGYPVYPDTTNPASIALYYRLVKGDKDKFLENILSASVSDTTRSWLQLGKQRNPDSWEMYPSEVNAYFSPPANEIVFPAGILQPPFFNKNWPSYLSYGAFGHVASHELTHAFDSAGRLYNQKGKLEQWWTNSTSQGFQVKQDCIVEQYSGYSIDDGKGGKVYVNGNLTSGENIGDTGLIQAYRAWKAQYDSSYKAGNEYLLPGLSFTREQLFFVSFARVWARSMKSAAAVQRIRTDPHSPNNFRVDGTVFNIPEFAEAFKCPKNSTLNPPPEKQCIFWGRS